MEFLLQAILEIWGLVKGIILAIAPIYVAYHLQKARENTKKPGSQVDGPDRVSHKTED